VWVLLSEAGFWHPIRCHNKNGDSQMAENELPIQNSNTGETDAQNAPTSRSGIKKVIDVFCWFFLGYPIFAIFYVGFKPHLREDPHALGVVLFSFILVLPFFAFSLVWLSLKHKRQLGSIVARHKIFQGNKFVYYGAVFVFGCQLWRSLTKLFM